MAALQTKRGVSLLVYAIIGIIIAVLMLTFMSSIVGDFLSEYPTVSGEVIPEKVICFNGGDNNSVHCLWKVGEEFAGQETFTFIKAKKWKANVFSSAPVLRPEALYFAIGNHVCAYTSTGPLWNNCYVSSGTVITNLAVNDRLVCFGTSQKKYECLSRDSGIMLYQKEASSKTESAPTLTEDFLYLAIGERVEKYNALTAEKVMDSNNELWGSKNKIIPWNNIVSGISVADDVVCFEPNDKDYSLVCLTDKYGTYLWRESGAATNSKPIIENGFVYFAIDSKLYKQHIFKDDTGAFTDKTGEATIDVGAKVTTNLASNEDEICAGSDDYVSCRNKITLEHDFIVTAPRNANTNNKCDWDSCDAESTPAMSSGIVYFGLGDKVCAYNIITMKNFSGSAVHIAPNDAEWCADYDYQIESDIAVLNNIPAEVI